MRTPQSRDVGLDTCGIEGKPVPDYGHAGAQHSLYGTRVDLPLVPTGAPRDEV